MKSNLRKEREKRTYDKKMRKLVENSSEREDTEDLFQAGPNRTLICEGFERMRNAKTLDTDVRPADPTYTWSEISS